MFDTVEVAKLETLLGEYEITIRYENTANRVG